jgi:hypothetical protein
MMHQQALRQVVRSCMSTGWNEAWTDDQCQLRPGDFGVARPEHGVSVLGPLVGDLQEPGARPLLSGSSG